jgi:flagellar hook assembly protein FlgD
VGWGGTIVRRVANSTDVAEDTGQTLASRLILRDNYPNPFNPQTTIYYTLPEPGRVQLEIFNVGGALIRTLVDETQAAGERLKIWDGRDDHGRAASSGVYFYRLRTGNESVAKRMVLLR